MIQETFGGVELLALYGDEERVGLDDEMLGLSWRSRIMPSLAAKIAQRRRLSFSKNMFSRVRSAARGRRMFRFSGDDGETYFMTGDGYVYDNRLELLGDADSLGGFFAKIKGGLRKIGRVTSGITTGIARRIGIPESVLSAASRLDPTRRGGPSAQAAAKELTKPPKRAILVKPSAFKLDAKNIAIIGGAGVAGIVLIKVLSSPRR